MQQRRLRLGDTLDDYCPRERRLTNHAVVAMVGDAVKRTRCTTCDAEHEYKEARVPPRRKKAEAPGALYSQVLSGMSERAANGGAAGHRVAEPEDEAAGEPLEGAPPAPEETREAREDERGNHEKEEGPVHRPLIRATLPRVDGPSARPAPEFTVRQSQGGREGNFRRGRPGDTRGGMRFSDPRQGRGGRGPQGRPSPFTSQGGSRSPSQPRPGRAHGRHGRKHSK